MSTGYCLTVRRDSLNVEVMHWVFKCMSRRSLDFSLRILIMLPRSAVPQWMKERGIFVVFIII